MPKITNTKERSDHGRSKSGCGKNVFGRGRVTRNNWRVLNKLVHVVYLGWFFWANRQAGGVPEDIAYGAYFGSTLGTPFLVGCVMGVGLGVCRTVRRLLGLLGA